MGWSDVLSGAGAFLANPTVALGALGGASSAYQNYEQKKAAGKQMEFQGLMSSTAYSRAMKDMERAGLNPILAGKLGGASTPGGAMPMIHGLHSGVQSGVATATDAMRTGADVNLKEEQALSQHIDNYFKKIAVNEFEGSKLVEGTKDILQQVQNFYGDPERAMEMSMKVIDLAKEKAYETGGRVKETFIDNYKSLLKKAKIKLEQFGIDY